jgi:hypothetical protein
MAGGISGKRGYGSIFLLVALLAITAPSALAASTGSDARRQCIDAALVMPKVKHAYMVHPGRRPFEKHPHVVGPIQLTRVAVSYPDVRPRQGEAGECDERVLRVEHGNLQKTVKGKWRQMADAR